MGYVAFKEERFYKRDGEGDGDGDVFMGSKMMKFQNIENERDGQWSVSALVTLYRAKYITRLELVEVKIGK